MTPGVVTVVDETLREGMQYRGLVFSLEEKETILRYQHRLGVDICQAGYPSAHPSEKIAVARLEQITRHENLDIRVAGMGRAVPWDVSALVETGISHFHLHAHIPRTADAREKKRQMDCIRSTITDLRHQRPGCTISLAMVDLGRTPKEDLKAHGEILIKDMALDILSLPDTSGMMAPHRFHDAVAPMAAMAQNTNCNVSVHCHNDLGMATANTVMGVMAGATVVEVSALGIGERNGMGDLFTVGRILKSEGCRLNLKTDQVDLFREYYRYVDDICRRRTGNALFTYNTPFFGDAAATHVAGTHAGTVFGVTPASNYFLNVLCGRRLVEKYLNLHGIPFTPETLGDITAAVKDESARLCRALHLEEVRTIARNRQKAS